MLSVSLYDYFSSYKIAKYALKKCVLFSSSNLLLVCLLQKQQKRCMGVYKPCNSTDLMLSFFKVYLCFPLNLRRTKNKHNCVYFILQGQVDLLFSVTL